ncbi:uncharacterized protein M6B38_290930 [Iris pallida]|uniref:DUF569 domain-containing protein n=1 Tax=Iris pallida TaxID=29817 RepID=A0AAX6HVZ1_IRIPA|nr:uncharacterized protein M6B38_290930 [Iris pallida]
MELFKSAKAVRLRSHHNKYLVAEEDEESVRQDRSGSSRGARWTVELVDRSPGHLRLKSCYGRYLSASGDPFLLGMTGRRVLQAVPARPDDPSVEWEPVRDGFQARLKTRCGHFLRANGGLPPWRNSVTHDTPHRTSTQNWVLWDVEILEIDTTQQMPAKKAAAAEDYSRRPPPPPPLQQHDVGSSPRSTLSTASSPRLSTESLSSFSGSPHKSEGRTIYYAIAEDDGTVDNSGEQSFSFKGTSVAELTEKLEEETELSGVIVCSRNPLNGQLCPLRLQLPPNNSTMHIVVVQAASKVAKTFNRP